jgi:hypothetical protein
VAHRSTLIGPMRQPSEAGGSGNSLSMNLLHGSR